MKKKMIETPITDYQDFCPIDTPLYRRREWNVGDIFSNGLHCKLCGDHIRSKNRHHFVECSCGNCFVDGGSHYVRIGCKTTSADYELETILYNEISEEE